MEKQRRKDIQAKYKAQRESGGIYVIRNIVNGKVLLLTTTNMQGSKNRFEFSQKTGSCENPKLTADYRSIGNSAFIFEILETLDMGDEQTYENYVNDLKILQSLWLEKFDANKLY